MKNLTNEELQIEIIELQWKVMNLQIEIINTLQLAKDYADSITCKIVADVLVGVLNDKRNYRTK